MRTLSNRSSYILISVVGILCIIIFYLMTRIEELETEGASMEAAHKEMKGKVIRELLSNMPGVYLEAEHHMRRGETRDFTINIHGMGDSVQFATPPEVIVFRNGVKVQKLRYPDQIRDSFYIYETSNRMLRFTWTADYGPGVYELWINVESNKVSLQPSVVGAEARVRIGSLEFSRREIKEAIHLSDDEELYIQDSRDRRILPDNKAIIIVH